MTQIITMGNFKGGTGKTTSSLLTSYCLARKGKKTLLVDLDPQANSTQILLQTIINFTGKEKQPQASLMKSIQDKDLSQSLVHITENLNLIASSTDLALYPRYLQQKTKDYVERVKYLSQFLWPLAANYDFVIIDTPPTISLLTDSALYTSDWFIIVMQTQQQSFDGAKNYINYIQNDVINTYKAPNLDLLGILEVLLEKRASVDETILYNAKKDFGQENIFKTVIPHMARIKRFGITGITDSDRFDQAVFKKYDQVVNEIFKRIGDNK